MRIRPLLLTLALATLVAATPAPAVAHGAGGPLERRLLADPELANDPRVQRLVRLEAELHDLRRRCAILERETGAAALAYVEAARAVDGAEQAVNEAHDSLDDRIRTAYQLGPGVMVEALLGAESFADLASISEYTSRTVVLDARSLHEVVVARAVAEARRASAAAVLAELQPRVRRLGDLLLEMHRKVDEAARLARQLYLDDRWLEQQRAALAEADARRTGWDALGTGATGKDQSALLALLGPTGGQTCEMPAGLVDTGESFSGYSTWYGWDFAGQSTANGAIFDPRLFTAANRWLPFGTFLRVHYRDRCAIVLVNDRGPYGNLERVIDLSMAAGQYLGVGVSWVTAEILVPEGGLPA
jgi:hypothetical protein